MSAVNFNWEKDARVGALDRKAARQRIRKGSKCHKAYPHECRPSCFAHCWEGLNQVLKAHKHLMGNELGQTTIFLAESGTGKTTAIKALIFGDTGVKPKRSLTVRFSMVERSTNRMGNEQQILDRVADLVDCPKAGKNVSPHELADFLVSAVTRDEKTTIAAAQSILPSISKLGSSFMSMLRGEAVYGGGEEDEDVPRPVKITALPNEDKKPSKKQWPIILFDDVNFDFEQGGLFATFLYVVAQQASGLEMICYVVTKERRIAYLIWQANGGNWIQPHEALKERHAGRARSLQDLAALDTNLLPDDLGVLNPQTVPKDCFFQVGPFHIRQGGHGGSDVQR
jgi:hypothetical protein